MTTLECGYFHAGLCRSCTLIEIPYSRQLAGKQARAEALIGGADGAGGIEWLEPVASEVAHFRTKAKMVVGGTADAPTLGILDAEGRGVDLSDCPIVDGRVLAALAPITRFIALAAITPYAVPSRRGELKHVIVTVSPAGDLMVRFVLRSSEPVPRIRKHLGTLLDAIPGLAVVSANIQPVHAAILEGDEEIAIHGDVLELAFDGVTLQLLPRSFVQTNNGIAAGLYRAGAAWLAEVEPGRVWDLYSGAGGFALHAAAAGSRVVGVEVSEAAVASAQAAARAFGVDADFLADDATRFALEAVETPGAVIVNPPRRGIGAELAGWLEDSGIRHVLYSSCNAESLARDLAAMPSLRPVRAQVFDMFPHTAHFETLVLLARDPAGRGH